MAIGGQATIMMASSQMDRNFRLFHLTHTNNIPTDIETREIQDIISRESNELSAIEFQIKDLEKLWVEHAQRSSGLQTLKATLSPIRRVPPELVAEIFQQLCCSSRAILPPNPVTPQLVVSQICSGWRKVALGHKQLWNRVAFAYDLEDEDGYESQSPKYMVLSQADIELSETWLSRAGSIPLDLELNCRNYDCADDPVQRLLSPRVQQCRSIVIRVPQVSLRPFVRLPTFDMLEHLTVHIVDRWTPVPVLFPNLRSLALEYHWVFESDLKALGMFAPWSQLAHLRVESFSTTGMEPSWFIDILRNCISLVDCYLDLTVRKYANRETPVIVLPHLRTLCLDGSMSSMSHTTSLLRYLTLPSLEELQISLLEFSADLFVSLASRSGFTLQILSLSGCDNSQTRLIDRHGYLLQTFLCVIPSLLSLSVDGSLSVNRVTDPVVMTGIARYELLPQLETLHITHCPLDYSAFLGVIESRRLRLSHRVDTGPGVPLRSSLKCLMLAGRHSEMRLRQIADVDGWKDDGLDIRFNF